jgi:hypothetical protein
MDQLCWECGALPKAATIFPQPRPSHVFIHCLLTSNDVPLDSETSFIRDIISDRQSQVDLLDTQIENLEVTMARLTRKPTRLRNRFASIALLCRRFAECPRNWFAKSWPCRCLPITQTAQDSKLLGVSAIYANPGDALCWHTLLFGAPSIFASPRFVPLTFP